MSYQVIARKWRPQTFEEVTGQEAITQTLRNAIEHDRLHHAYLFSGARGVGKTTTARLLAKALNCHKTAKPNPVPCSPEAADACASCKEIAESRSIDVFEFDAASHTGVDDIREIILESINIAPARDRYKIFIIDEVHMLSTSSFNALLKTLEEPPPNVEFIMATTELHKVPITILSRCQEFEFRTIPLNKIFARLKLIADAEKINVADEALREIARSGEGSMRDAQSNFDQVISFSGERIEVPDVANALGLASTEMLVRIVTAIAHNKPVEALNVVDDLIARGHDLRNYCRDLLSFFRDLLIAKVADGSDNLLETAILSVDELQKYAHHFSESDLIRFFNSLSETESKLREATQSRYVLEIGLVKLIEMRRIAPLEKIVERLARLESALAGGSLPSANAVPAEPSPEKKNLKVDFPLDEVPFPVGKAVESDIPASVPPARVEAAGETSVSNGSAAIFTEPVSANGSAAAPARQTAIETGFGDRYETAFPPQQLAHLDDPREADLFRPDSAPPVPNIEFEPESNAAEQNQQSAIRNPTLREMIAAMPVKLVPITSEELEHFDEDKLDTAYLNKLARHGDNLLPIANAAQIAEELIGDHETGAGADPQESAHPNARKNRPVFQIPDFDQPDDDEELPVLSGNPTEAEMLDYARRHPTIKRILRTFRGEIVEVKKIN
ncbi:MAG: DNA polymerase III subunit gamma/tau [Acidobacteria bacterium]|nr:DNA polymerase III subunit gamma/tau [Acidobacteriota bacterium]